MTNKKDPFGFNKTVNNDALNKLDLKTLRKLAKILENVKQEVFKMDKKLEKLADQYEGNLLNYFCGMSPKQSKRFNKMVKDAKKNRRSK